MQQSVYVNRKKLIIIKIVLVFFNVILIAGAVISSLFYSDTLKKRQSESRLNGFFSTIESMKQISNNYFKYELSYANDWAKYISGNDMTVKEALEYINRTNSMDERYAHIVDMDTYEAYSSYDVDNDYSLDCYKTIYNEDSDFNRSFISNMKEIFTGNGDVVYVLGKYRADDTQNNVISVGTRVSLVKEEGNRKDYLLLRIIPVSSVRDIWVFPVEYQSAEVGIITRNGSYVIQSKSMKSYSFIDFIRGYNFENDYNKADVLYKEIQTTDKGYFRYKNSKGEECYWYYSDFGNNSQLDILGCIPVSQLDTRESNWIIVLMTCGILLLLIIFDGSYILHVNSQLRKTAEAAESANRSKTRFLSAMSHDIRTPLNGIIGMTNVAKGHVNDPDYIIKCLNKVSLAGDHLLMLVNDILDISKVESGKLALNASTFSMEQMIARIINIVQPQIKAKKQTLDIDTDIRHGYVEADELRISQVFINILTNAIKYTPEGGRIVFSVKETEISESVSRFIYKVTDNGIGMSKEFQESMYNTFAREKDSRIDKIQGSGLGLSIVKQIIELMEGRIFCESSPGQGTTFTVELDIKTAENKKNSVLSDSEAKEINEWKYEHFNILVAEDNDLNWEIVNELLAMYNINASRAVNGKECIDMLKESEDYTYGLVLMDIRMPVMDGREATRQIRKSDNEYIRNIPIVAMTADAYAEDIEECFKAGMNGHIAKPIRIDKILEYVDKIETGEKL